MAAGAVSRRPCRHLLQGGLQLGSVGSKGIHIYIYIHIHIQGLRFKVEGAGFRA